MPGMADAQSAGDAVLLFGATYIRPSIDNSAPHNKLRPSALFPALGIEDDFRSESVRLSASSTTTMALIAKYFVTDHWALSFTGGIPRKASVRATGTIGPTGPTRPLNTIDLGKDAFNPAASARQWAPIFLLEYHLLDADAKLRPYVAAGFTYAFFTELETNDNFKNVVNRRFGTQLALAAGRPGPTTNNTKIEDVFAPAFALGLGYRISQHWKLSTSVSYIRLNSTATVELNARDGTRLARSRTDIRFNPLVFTVLAGYRF